MNEIRREEEGGITESPRKNFMHSCPPPTSRSCLLPTLSPPGASHTEENPKSTQAPLISPYLTSYYSPPYLLPSGTLSFWLLLELSKHVPLSRIECLLFPPLRMLCPHPLVPSIITKIHSLSLFPSFLRCHLTREALLDDPGL